MQKYIYLTCAKYVNKKNQTTKDGVLKVSRRPFWDMGNWGDLQEAAAQEMGEPKEGERIQIYEIKKPYYGE